MITPHQAMKSLFHLRECSEMAAVGYYMAARTGDSKYYLNGLEKEFTKAAAALGFALVPLTPATVNAAEPQDIDSNRDDYVEGLSTLVTA
jgi:hypothetical protein